MGKGVARDLPGCLHVDTIEMDRTQERTEFMPSRGGTNQTPTAESILILPGKVVALPAYFPRGALNGANTWESVPRTCPTFPRRIGGDVSTVQLKKRKH